MTHPVNTKRSGRTGTEQLHLHNDRFICKGAELHQTIAALRGIVLIDKLLSYKNMERIVDCLVQIIMQFIKAIKIKCLRSFYRNFIIEIGPPILQMRRQLPFFSMFDGDIYCLLWLIFCHQALLRTKQRL